MLTHWIVAIGASSSFARLCRATATMVVSNSTAMPPTSTVHAVRHTAGSITTASVFTAGISRSFRNTLYPQSTVTD